MSDKKISLRQAFDDIFGQEDKYFGEWFLRSDQTLTDFLENNLTSKEIFFKQLRYLYLYLESLEILKKQANSKTIASAISKDIWYCCVLLLLIGLINQHTKSEQGNQKKRFQAVMNSLSEEEKHLLDYYDGNKHKTFDEITSHLYGTRNFFAHEIILPSGAIPHDGLLAIDDKKLDTMYLNLPHGRIFLSIVIALLRYLGFVRKIKIVSNKKFDSWSDMFRYS